MITIFWDLDNVLTDYHSYWGSDKTFNKSRFKTEVMDKGMFENIAPLRSGVELFWSMDNYLKDNNIEYNFQILSSLGSPNDIELTEEAARQKELWVRRYFGDFIGNLNFVEQKGKKKRFATPTSILIDDINENVWNFTECHGHGILFSDDMCRETIFKEVCDTINLVNDKIKRKIY